MIRKPAVAGTFYPSRSKELKEMIDKFMQKAKVDTEMAFKAMCFVAPHAGYVYSGQVAAHTYKALCESSKKRKIDTFIVLGPNHMGYAEFATVSLNDWETPLGIAKNDYQLSKQIASFNKSFSTNEEEIAHEHSIEVQVPFMQSLFPDAHYAFICMSDQSLHASRLVTDAILVAIEELNRSVMVIASSDFNHYESASVAEKKDKPAFEAIEKLNEEEFQDALRRNNDSACGYGPITVAMLFAKTNGAKAGNLLKYSNSGDITEDYNSVVAYASFAIA